MGIWLYLATGVGRVGVVRSGTLREASWVCWYTSGRGRRGVEGGRARRVWGGKRHALLFQPTGREGEGDEHGERAANFIGLGPAWTLAARSGANPLHHAFNLGSKTSGHWRDEGGHLGGGGHTLGGRHRPANARRPAGPKGKNPSWLAGIACEDRRHSSRPNLAAGKKHLGTEKYAVRTGRDSQTRLVRQPDSLSPSLPLSTSSTHTALTPAWFLIEGRVGR